MGFLLDLIIGDPYRLPHPVRGIGWLIKKLEVPIRAHFPKDAHGERTGGILLALSVIVLTGVVSYGVLWLAEQVGQALAFVLETVMCYQVLAMRSLCTESMKVCDALADDDLEQARTAVSLIVGRDTEHLDARQVAKAAVETVAENTSDGVIAPLFFLLLGGAPLAMCYKAVNTLDSMIGYKNERYMDFGRFAAKLDDAVNYIPARLSAVLMICTAAGTGLNARGAARIWRRDRRNHASPNSAQTESVCAGALNVQLAGDAVYGGVVFQKKTIGDDIRPVEPDDIVLANRLMFGTAFLALCIFSAARLAIAFMLNLI